MDNLSLVTPDERKTVAVATKSVLCHQPDAWHKLSYQEWTNTSKPSGSTIMLVHGLTQNSHVYDVLAEFLTAKTGHRCICPDMVGRGRSDWLKSSEYSYPRYVADVRTLISSLHITELYYLGTSMGGLIGMMLAPLKNSPIIKMCINDIGPIIPKEATTRIGSYVGKNMDFDGPEQAAAYFAKIYEPFGLKGALLDYFVQKFTLPTEKGVRLHYDPVIAEIFSAIKPEEAKDVDITPVWKAIPKTLPFLVFHGENSDVLTPAILAVMKEDRDSVSVHTVTGVGHAPMLHSLEEAEAILKFFS